jgi:glycosyltransferase involved in cell wall biosynthesis
MKPPLISVIVPAHNEELFIGDCLDSILRQDIQRELFELIVVDNASFDHTALIAQQRGAYVIFESKKGYVHALIAGVNASRGDILVFTDADCRVPRHWLSKFLSYFHKDPNLDAIGGVFDFYDGNLFFQMSAYFGKKFTYHLCGGNMAIRRDAYWRIGGFDPMVNAGADVLLDFKLRDAGGNIIIDPSLIVETSARRYRREFPWVIFRYLGNDIMLKLFKKPLFNTFSDIR